MRQRILALKVAAGSLAVGLFVLGWALVARADAAKAVLSAQQAPRRIVVVIQPGATSAPAAGNVASSLAPIPDLPPIPAPPPIRTRSS